ncbi:MAG TPA: hypothetical protein VFF37_05785 [Streptomyces sp.]|nr:hypothetical protein [Streptomyces sp.]
MYDTHTPTEWAAYGWLGVGAVGVIKFGLAFADADAAYFDPRPAVRRTAAVLHQGAVHTGHDLAWAAASVCHELASAAVYVRAVAVCAAVRVQRAPLQAAVSVAVLLALLLPTREVTR